MKYAQLVKAIDSASQQLLGHAAVAVNQALILRNWLIGAYIVEFEQQGEDRAKYGERLLERLAADLRARKVSGASPDMLERTRQFYVVYPQLGSVFSAPAVRKLTPTTFASLGAGVGSAVDGHWDKNISTEIPRLVTTGFYRTASGRNSAPAVRNSSGRITALPANALLSFPSIARWNRRRSKNGFSTTTPAGPRASGRPCAGRRKIL